MMAELYAVEERHLTYNVTSLLHFLLGFPRSVMAMDTVILRTNRSALFYNITLKGLDSPLQAFTAHVVTLHCSPNTTTRMYGDVMLYWHLLYEKRFSLQKNSEMAKWVDEYVLGW